LLHQRDQSQWLFRNEQLRRQADLARPKGGPSCSAPPRNQVAGQQLACNDRSPDSFLPARSEGCRDCNAPSSNQDFFVTSACITRRDCDIPRSAATSKSPAIPEGFRTSHRSKPIAIAEYGWCCPMAVRRAGEARSRSTFHKLDRVELRSLLRPTRADPCWPDTENDR